MTAAPTSAATLEQTRLRKDAIDPDRMAADHHRRTARVKALATNVGFDLVGVSDVRAATAYARYRDQMAAGYGADMAWLHEHGDAVGLREDVRRVHPAARSVIVVGVSYASDQAAVSDHPPAPHEGYIARYAQGRDYHLVVKRLLVTFARALAADPELGTDYPDSKDHRVFVDTGPVLEKALAQQAGLGWIGKNTLLLNRTLGSWLFLGVVLTPLELAPDAPGVDHCGSCRRCLDVCPTDAFPQPYVLDARRCIATWTIESDDPLAAIDAHGGRDALGPHVFGCDLCQEVCPWNRKVPPTRHEALAPRPGNVRPPLDDLIGLGDDAFKARFPKSAVRRTDAARLGALAELVQRRRRSADTP